MELAYANNGFFIVCGRILECSDSIGLQRPTEQSPFLYYYLFIVPNAVDTCWYNNAWRMNELSQSLITIIILALFIYSAFSSAFSALLDREI